MSGDRGLVDHSALTLRDLIATRAASPVEVLEAHLTEIARLNPALNAIVTLAGEQARAAAGGAGRDAGRPDWPAAGAVRLPAGHRSGGRSRHAQG